MSGGKHVPHSHVPMSDDPKFGAGFYSDNTIGCYNVIDNATDLVLKCVDAGGLNYDNKTAFVVVDYGTADGGTSMPLMAKLIPAVRAKYGEDAPVSIWYEDQAVNDFKSLFMRLQGLIPGPPSYYLNSKNVYVYAIGTSFYEQCCPPQSVHLGMSFTAMHWLTSRPCNLKDAIHHTISKDAEGKAAYAKQAEADWVKILEQRAAEMAPGGRMVIVNFTVDEHGQHLGFTAPNARPGSESMYETKNRIWKTMAEEGRITMDEYNNTTIANYYRTKEEFVKPFSADGAATKLGLKLVTAESRVTKCPYLESWLSADHGGRTAEEHAKWFVPTTRTWSNSSYLSGLNASRPDQEKASLVDELFDRYAAEVAKDPSKHHMDYVHSYMVILKE